MQIKSKKFFAKGKRGFIYTAKLGKKKIAIKEKNPESKAQSRIEFEAYWLKKLNCDFHLNHVLLRNTPGLMFEIYKLFHLSQVRYSQKLVMHNLSKLLLLV